MRQAEITIMLPPATETTAGDIEARTYPLAIQATGSTDMVRLDGVSIVPSSGVAEVWVSGGGGVSRRQIVERETMIPQAAGSPFRPLDIALVNLNPDAAVQLVVTLSIFDRQSGYGGGARFQGANPFGTDGVREPNYSDQAGTQVVQCQGSGFVAWMVTNAATVTRTIREITGRTRILSPTGTGTIPVGGDVIVSFIVKKDGVILEANADTLDIVSGVFSVDVPTAGTARLLSLAADAIATAMIQNGAVTEPKLGAGAVTSSKIAADAVGASHIAADAIDAGHIDAGAVGTSELANTSVTTAKLADGAVTPAKLANPAPHMWASPVSSGLASGTMASATLISLPAGTYQLFAMMALGGQGSGGLVDGDIELNRPGMARWSWDRVRYEHGVDTSHVVMAFTTGYVHGGGHMAFSGSFAHVAGSTFDSTNGYLMAQAWRTA